MANELVGNTWLIDFPTPSMRLVVMRICESADPDGTNIFPSASTIAEETTLGISTVRANIAILEQCGLLDVKENKYGNRYGKTTVVRELDTDLMRLITGRRVRGKGKIPSTHVLAGFDIEVPAGSAAVQIQDAVRASLIETPPAVARNMKIWAIVPRPTPPAIGGADGEGTSPAIGGAPLQQLEGYPSSRWSPPLQPLEGAPPAIGANPFMDPPNDPSPPTPRGLRRKGREGEVDDLISKISTPERGRAIQILFEPLARRLKIEAPDPAFALGQLADWVRDLPDEVLTEARCRLFETRRLSAKASDIEEAVKRAKHNAENAAKLESSPYLFDGSPQWKRALALLEQINPSEANWMRAQSKYLRRDLEKLGVRL